MDAARSGATAPYLAGWLYGLLLLAIGVLNLLLVHPVPAAAYALVSLVYFPPVSGALGRRSGIRLPATLKVVLGVVVIWFTLGISDLGDMID